MKRITIIIEEDEDEGIVYYPKYPITPPVIWEYNPYKYPTAYPTTIIDITTWG